MAFVQRTHVNGIEPMTKTGFAVWRAAIGISQEQAATMLGLTLRTIGRYERGSRDGKDVDPPLPVRILMSLRAQGCPLECVEPWPMTAEGAVTVVREIARYQGQDHRPGPDPEVEADGLTDHGTGQFAQFGKFVPGLLPDQRPGPDTHYEDQTDGRSSIQAVDRTGGRDRPDANSTNWRRWLKFG